MSVSVATRGLYCPTGKPVSISTKGLYCSSALSPPFVQICNPGLYLYPGATLFDLSNPTGATLLPSDTHVDISDPNGVTVLPGNTFTVRCN